MLIGRFSDLQEKSRYLVKIRAKNQLGFSNFSNQFIVTTLDSPIPVEQYPQIGRAYFAVDGRRIRFQLNEMRSTSVGKDQWCLQYYSPPSGQVETEDETLTCVPLTSLPTKNDEFEITPTEEHSQVRLRLCLINQTDLCSKSSAIPTGMPLVNDSSELILILIGKDFASIGWTTIVFSPLGAILGLCVVAGVAGLFVCIQQRRRKNQSRNGSTDTLKANSTTSQLEQFHATPVRVIDTNSCLYYPAQTTINERMSSRPLLARQCNHFFSRSAIERLSLLQS